VAREGAGGYSSAYFQISAGSIVTITVGDGGTGMSLRYTSSDNSTLVGNKGSSGFVMVAYGGEIEI